MGCGGLWRRRDRGWWLRGGGLRTDWVSDLAQKALRRLLFLLLLVASGDVVAALRLLGGLLFLVGHGVLLARTSRVNMTVRTVWIDGWLS